MSNIVTLCALFCAVLSVRAQAAKEVPLPSGIKVCNHTSTDYASCLKNALQESWSTIVEGIPELGIPPLEPVDFDKYHYDFNIIGVYKSQLDLRDAKTYGLSNATFLSVRPTRSADRMRLDIDFNFPRTFAGGYYKALGRIGFLKIGGEGYFNQTSKNVRATWSIDGRIENDRWVIEYSGIRNPLAIKIEKLKFYFDDLFNGNKLLNNAALTFVNTSWPVLFLGMTPIVWKSFMAQSTELTKQIFSKLSFAEAFP